MSKKPIPDDVALKAGYAYVDAKLCEADGVVGIAPFWHGWAVREAFISGARWAELILFNSTDPSANPSVTVSFAADGGFDQMRKTLAAMPAGTQLYNHELTSAARDVLAERHRQIVAEGWSTQHDDEHAAGKLAAAGACYAAFTQAYPAGDPPRHWPWAPEWWKPSADRRRNWVKSCALILAEIERYDRTAIANTPSRPVMAVEVYCYWPDGSREQYEFDHWPDRSELPADAVRVDIALPYGGLATLVKAGEKQP